MTAPHDVIVIGASWGGVEAVMRLVSALPRDFPAAVFIVIHFSPHTPAVLPQILSHQGRLRAVQPRDGDPIVGGLIYVAPPGRHMLLHDNTVEVSPEPESRHRPSIDLLFESAAATFGERVVGVVLTGALDDGAAGLSKIRARGGVAIVQDPLDAANPSMPHAALERAHPQHVLRLDEVGPKLVELAGPRVLPRR